MTSPATYGNAFSRVYAARWGAFARNIAPRLLEHYEATAAPGIAEPERRRLLDLCCGTGHLAVLAAQRGYIVTGLDLSPHMLAQARSLAREAGVDAVQWLCGDAARFALARRYGLIVSTYDALNHLPDLAALEACLRCAAEVAADGGLLLFDPNTERGLRQWHNLNVDDGEEMTIIARGLVAPSSEGLPARAWTRLTGYVRLPEGLYERFEETIGNTLFRLEEVNRVAEAAGWRLYWAQLDDLAMPLSDPESIGRAWAVGRRRGR